jgi:hypothetical protein
MGDSLGVRDCRGKERAVPLTEPDGRGGCGGPTLEGAYHEAGLPLRLERGGAVVAEATIAALPPAPGEVVAGPGDLLLLATPDVHGPPTRDAPSHAA